MKGYSLGLMGLQDSRSQSFPKIENSDLGIVVHTYNSIIWKAVVRKWLGVYKNTHLPVLIRFSKILIS